MLPDITGIEFQDFQGKVIRKTKSITDNKVYAPIIKVLPGSIFEDRDFDGDCMFSIDFIEKIVNTRKELKRNIVTGK